MATTTTETTTIDPLVAGAGAVFRRVLVPVDFEMSSHIAVGVALHLQRAYGSAVCLYHAASSTGSDDWLGGIGSPAVGGDWVAQSKARLRRFLENVAPSSAGLVEVMASIGDGVHGIRKAAQEWSATLVVCAASVHPEFLRSEAERLVRELRVPTLILPMR